MAKTRRFPALSYAILACRLVAVWSIEELEAEKMIELEIRACGSVDLLNIGSTKMPYAEMPEADELEWCFTLRTDRNLNDYFLKQALTTALKATVVVKWRKLNEPDENRHCTMVFKGYQGSYRLSPDFGYYATCNVALSRYREVLAESQNSPSLQNASLYETALPNDSLCPILKLPATYANYLQCELETNEWYKLEFRSEVFAEFMQNRTYDAATANQKVERIFRPMAVTVNSNADWLDQMVQIKVGFSKCRMKILLTQGSSWTEPTSVQLFYRTKPREHSETLLRLLLNTTLDTKLHPWAETESKILPQNASEMQFLCMNLTSVGIALTPENLHCVEIDPSTCSGCGGFAKSVGFVCFAVWMILGLRQ